jgi:hypothetical protein
LPAFVELNKIKEGRMHHFDAEAGAPHFEKKFKQHK